MLALARSELLRHDVVLRTELAADGRPVMGDRVQLQQVLLNLIMNGVEAMRDVTERTRELTVSSALAEPSNVLVAVEDAGAGLDPAVAQRMFEPFVTTKSDGLGMGLAICRSIVEAHGGRLWVSPRAARSRLPLHCSGMGGALTRPREALAGSIISKFSRTAPVGCPTNHPFWDKTRYALNQRVACPIILSRYIAC